MQETYREELSFVALEQGLDGQLSLLLCLQALGGSVQTGTILPVWNPLSAWLILKLHWPSEIGQIHPVFLDLVPTDTQTALG